MGDQYFVSLEDHFVSPVLQQDDVADTLQLHQFSGPILERVTEVGPKRIQAMEEGHVRLQIVSHIPVVLSLTSCRAANDQLCDKIRQHRPRFAGFATLPVSEPKSIPDELERCVRSLNFHGALIPNHANGAFYDGPEYHAMWQTAERLGVPVYLHPCPPSSRNSPSFQGSYSGDVSFAIGTHAWDWHASCGLHFVRLYASGLFDLFPKLKVVLGHLGELIPFMIGRIERKLALTADAALWKASFSEVYKRNVWITTSGMFDIEPFELVLKTTSIDRIMFSVDYPFESTLQSWQFMEKIRLSGLVSGPEFSKIAHGNAERLLGL